MSSHAIALDRLLSQRHSCRAFLPQGLPHDLILKLLESARHTASWCNTQPWGIVVTTGAGTERFRRAMQAAARSRPPLSDIPFPPGYQGSHQQRRREAGFQLYDAVGVTRGDREASAAQSLRNFDFFDAPHVLIVTVPRSLGPYALVDVGGWIANFLLAAQAHDVAAIAQAALAQQATVVRAHFGLHADAQVVCGISFGYADVTSPANSYRTSRAPLHETVVWSSE